MVCQLIQIMAYSKHRLHVAGFKWWLISLLWRFIIVYDKITAGSVWVFWFCLKPNSGQRKTIFCKTMFMWLTGFTFGMKHGRKLPTWQVSQISYGWIIVLLFMVWKWHCTMFLAFICINLQLQFLMTAHVCCVYFINMFVMKDIVCMYLW